MLKLSSLEKLRDDKTLLFIPRLVYTLGCIMFGLGQKVFSRLAWSKFRPNLASQWFSWVGSKVGN